MHGNHTRFLLDAIHEPVSPLDLRPSRCRDRCVAARKSRCGHPTLEEPCRLPTIPLHLQAGDGQSSPSAIRISAATAVGPA